MLYTLIAKRFGRDSNGDLWTVDKRVHTQLSAEECRQLHRRYSPKLTQYWSEVHSFVDDDYDDELYDGMFAELMDGVGEGQPL